MRKVSSAVHLTLAVHRESPQPMHRQIYDGYRAAIVSRTLRPGQRVPSSRGLAVELGISRIPVLTAYAQLLAEGYLETRVGFGTTVSRSLPDPPVSAERAKSHSRSTIAAGFIAEHRNLPESMLHPPWGRGWGAFGVGQVAFEQFPFKAWNSLITRHCRGGNVKSLDYGDPMGLQALREAIAAYLGPARGVRCDADQIMIVSGSQQALDICTRALIRRGSRVWMEEPGYRFARQVFALNDCRIVPIPVDREGLDITAGVDLRLDARAVLVTPSHQYPLGFTMSASRRLKLLDWAERAQSWIFEDDYDSEYRYENMPISSLQGLDPNGRVIYIGTFSKVLFPSLRLGYIVIPRGLVKHFQAIRVAMDIGPPTLLQAVLGDFIREDHFSRHIRRMRLLYSERRTALLESLHSAFGPDLEVTGQHAGMHLCIFMNRIHDLVIARRAASSKLWLVPLSSSYAGESARHGFILGYGSTSAEQMNNAVGKLQTAIYGQPKHETRDRE